MYGDMNVLVHIVTQLNKWDISVTFTSISETSKDHISDPESVFHTLIKPAKSDVATMEPSWLNPTLATVSVWPTQKHDWIRVKQSEGLGFQCNYL